MLPIYEQMDKNITSKFVGYDKLENESVISTIATEDEIVEAITDGDMGTIVVDETVFYATMGGQAGDIGVITNGEQ